MLTERGKHTDKENETIEIFQSINRNVLDLD